MNKLVKSTSHCHRHINFESWCYGCCKARQLNKTPAPMTRIIYFKPLKIITKSPIKEIMKTFHDNPYAYCTVWDLDVEKVK